MKFNSLCPCCGQPVATAAYGDCLAGLIHKTSEQQWTTDACGRPSETIVLRGKKMFRSGDADPLVFTRVGTTGAVYKAEVGGSRAI